MLASVSIRLPSRVIQTEDGSRGPVRQTVVETLGIWFYDCFGTNHYPLSVILRFTYLSSPDSAGGGDRTPTNQKHVILQKRKALKLQFKCSMELRAVWRKSARGGDLTIHARKVPVSSSSLHTYLVVSSLRQSSVTKSVSTALCCF